MTYEEALKINKIGPPEFDGVSPINSSIWFSLLTDLATSLYQWTCPSISFFDLLLIEKYIHNKQMFAVVNTKRKLTNSGLYLKTGFQVLPCTPSKYGYRNRVEKIQVNIEKPLKGFLLEYDKSDFVMFDNLTLSNPSLLVRKYADILGKLDALYSQNIDKLSVPIITITNKNQKNDLLSIFKRTKINALFSLVNSESKKDNVKESFFNPQIEFILDKVNAERQAIMKEFLQELGINPRNEQEGTSQYVNDRAIAESSLIAKYFATSLNKFRDSFVNKVNNKFNIDLSYETTVKNNLDLEVKNEQ